MNILNVNDKSRGFTLAEMLVTTLLSTLIITAASGVMLTIAKRAQWQTTTLLLQNTLSETMHFIQDEVRRAGQNIPLERYQTASGDVKPWYIEDNMLSLHYKEGETYLFSAVKADSQTGKLRYCTERMTDFISFPSCSAYYSMFDNKQLRLQKFEIKEIPAAGSAQTAMFAIVITAQSVNNGQSHTVSALVSARYNQRL